MLVCDKHDRPITVLWRSSLKFMSSGLLQNDLFKGG